MSKGRKYPVIIIGGRDITLRQKPGTKPVEERMSIVSNRVTMTFRDGTAHRLESELEASAMEMFNANPDVVAIRTQFGPLPFRREGKDFNHFADLCVDFRNGCRNLYAVRAAANVGNLEFELDLIRKGSLKRYAHGLYLLTENEITKPAVMRAEQMVRSQTRRNTNTTAYLFDALVGHGVPVPIFELYSMLEGKLSFSELWTAIWALFDQGVIRHDHPDPANAVMTRLSRISIVEEDDHA
jgi:hypothetical protein